MYAYDKVVGVVKVTKIKDLKRRGMLVTCDTHVYKNCAGLMGHLGDEGHTVGGNPDVVPCIQGEATVWLPRQLQ